MLGEKSGSVDRGVLTLSTGLRFHASALSDRWRYRIQTGVSAWLPTSDATLTLGVDEYTVQQPAIGFSVGVTFDFD